VNSTYLREIYCPGIVFQVSSNISIEIETINIFLPLCILILNKFSFNKGFGKKEKTEKQKISLGRRVIVRKQKS